MSAPSLVRAAFTYPTRPLRVYWETTRACDLACRHCRALAVPEADPTELTFEEGRALLRNVAAFGSPLPHLVFTGGDPFKRDDLFNLIAYARELGLGVSVAPSATPLLTADALRHLREAGVDAISLSLDGATPGDHDAIRGIQGTYERTVNAALDAARLGLPFQVNTLVCAETADSLPAIHQQVMSMGAARWSLFFLIAVGRGQVLRPVTAERAEEILRWIAELPGRRGHTGCVVTTTEAPQLRRVLAEKQAKRSGAITSMAQPHGVHHGAGIRDGNGIVFISHTGEICPSGFLELAAGNVRADDLVDVYRHSGMFTALRDVRGFGGRCGPCEYGPVCGGSRARAYAASGDFLAEDPLCRYDPGTSAV
jgi:AdoMet-dependent heme synthase